MTVYLLNIGLIIIYGVLWHNSCEHNKRKFCFLASLNWIVVSGLRHISIGDDTSSYNWDFTNNGQQSMHQLIHNFYDVYFNGAAGKDMGYPIFVRFIYNFTNNYQVYLVIIALIFTVAFGIFIYKNSSEPLMSFLIYSTLFAGFTMTGIRQTIALTLVVLIGYDFIKKRNLFGFIVISLVAFTIHKSAISFFPFYFLCNKKITVRYLMSMSAIIILAFIFKNNLMNLIGSILGYSNYNFQYEGAGTWTFTIIYVFTLIIAMWKNKEIISNNPNANHYFNAILFAAVLLPLTFINPSALRGLMYYSFFLTLLIPEIILSFKNQKDRKIIYYLGVVIMIALFVKNNPQYLFFWQ